MKEYNKKSWSYTFQIEEVEVVGNKIFVKYTAGSRQTDTVSKANRLSF